MTYHDLHGYVLPNADDLTSENPSLFTIELALLKDEAGELTVDDLRTLHQLITQLWETNGGEYHVYPNDEEEISLDDATAIAAICKKIDLPGYKRNLKKLKLFRHYSAHPKDFIFILWCKYPWIGIWFLWFTSIAMFASCLRTYKYRVIVDFEAPLESKLIVDIKNILIGLPLIGVFFRKKWLYATYKGTDGKLLAYVRCQAGMPITKKICEWLLSMNKLFKNWSESFQHYFRYDNNHPIIITAKKVWVEIEVD